MSTSYFGRLPGEQGCSELLSRLGGVRWVNVGLQSLLQRKGHFLEQNTPNSTTPTAKRRKACTRAYTLRAHTPHTHTQLCPEPLGLHGGLRAPPDPGTAGHPEQGCGFGTWEEHSGQQRGLLLAPLQGSGQKGEVAMPGSFLPMGAYGTRRGVGSALGPSGAHEAPSPVQNDSRTQEGHLT